MFRNILIVLTFIGFWQLIALIFVVPDYLLPTPFRVSQAFIENYHNIFISSVITLTEALVGFFVANLISVLIAIFIVFNPNWENGLMSVAIVIKTLPIIALAPLLVIWFGSGLASKAMAAMLVCFFPSLVNIIGGVKVLDQKLFWLFKVYAADRWQLVRFFIFPSILPYLFAALKTSSSLAVVGALVGEFIGANRGLGFLIVSNYYNMNTPLVFAAILTSSLIGVVFYYTINLFEERFIFYQRRVSGVEIRNI